MGRTPAAWFTAALLTLVSATLLWLALGDVAWWRVALGSTGVVGLLMAGVAVPVEDGLDDVGGAINYNVKEIDHGVKEALMLLRHVRDAKGKG